MYDPEPDFNEAREVRREYFSYREAEIFSGLGRTTLWRLVGAGEIKASKIGRAVRISRRSLEAFMEHTAVAGEGRG